MSSARVNSIIARCLLDPDFLERLTQSPEATLQGYGLDADTYADFLESDFDRIRHFAGFITKVQHNHLWEVFPYSRALLKYYDVELKVFTAYRAQHQRNRADGLARDERLRRFIAFLSAYLESPACPACPGFADILEHERLSWEIKLSLSAPPLLQARSLVVDASALSMRQLQTVVPAVQGVIRIGAFTYDPFEVIERLSQRTFAPDRLSRNPRALCYWGDHAAEQLRVFELDPALVTLLTHVDGCCSIRTIIARTRKALPNAVRPAHFRPFFEHAFGTGILGLRAATS